MLGRDAVFKAQSTGRKAPNIFLYIKRKLRRSGTDDKFYTATGTGAAIYIFPHDFLIIRSRGFKGALVVADGIIYMVRAAESYIFRTRQP